MERREANDGQRYTYEEFCGHYGHAGPRRWDAAKKEARPEHSDVKPLAEDPPRNRDTNEDGSKRLARFKKKRSERHAGAFECSECVKDLLPHEERYPSMRAHMKCGLNKRAAFWELRHSP